MNGPLAHDRLEQRTHNPLVLCSTHRGPTNDVGDDNIIDAEWEEVLRPDPELVKIYKMVENMNKPSYIGRRISFII